MFPVFFLTTMCDQDKIDLQKLSQKELLIVTYREVQTLSSTVADFNKEQQQLRERLAVVETKQKITGLIWGSISGAVSSGVVALFISLLK